MPKFFISDCSKDIDDIIDIVGNDARHIAKTLRMREGEKLTVTSSDSTDYSCVIESVSPDLVELRVLDKLQSASEGEIKISLFQALVKGDKMETVIQKSVELGVNDIYPVAAERSIVKLDSATEKKKLERWNKIALEAAKQCGRGIIPTVHNVLDFNSCVEKLPACEVGFFCYELAEEKTLKALISDKSFTSVGFFIGPEGGVSNEEASLAISKGIEPVSLGKLILRTETAGPAVMAMLLYETRL